MKLLLLVFCFLSFVSYGQNCRGIQKKVDKFDGNTSFIAMATGPLLQMGNPGAISVIGMGKIISKADTAYIVSISVDAFSVPEPESRKGVILLFSDGSRIEKPEQPASVSFTGAQNHVSVELMFDEVDFAQMAKKTLTDVRIAGKDGTVHPKLAKSVNTYGECLLTSW